ncbi:MAG: PP2C family protein-serine/threonine phosphatase [Segatella copri]
MKIKIYQPLAIHELGKRANQEDSIYPIEGKATEKDRLFLLCDGMGGHEHGEVASQSICKSLSSFLLQHAVASEGLEDKLLSDALAYAYEELDKLAIAGDSRQMGTTLTLLYFHSNGCTTAHIGDSRIYHLRPSSHTILYKSRDHSLVYDLYQAGELTYEEMKTFPQKNVITRAMIAGDRNHPKPDVIHISDIQPGDYFYICSDGMLEQMEDEELLDVFVANVRDEEKRQMLISGTSDNKDNHSAYIVHIKEVSHDEADVSLVNEEPTAKCNALNIKPDVEKLTASPDVEVVKPAGTPPPVPDSVIVEMENRQKRKKLLFVAFMAIVVLAVVGMFGYGYYSKHKAEAALLDSLHEDSMMTVKEFNSQKESKTDTTKPDSIK